MSNWRVISTAEQGSDEWLEARRGGIGGSDVAAVVGANPWRTPLEVWLDKTGQMPREGKTNERMGWGHRLEPVIREHYAAQRQRTWVDEVPGVLAHPSVTIAQASLDGLVNAESGQWGLEVKTTGQTWDRPPDMYLLQVTWYMAVTGLPKFDIAVLSRGQEYSEFTVERDDRLCDDLLGYADEWWTQHVVAGTMPDPDLVRDRDLLARLWTPDVAADPVVIPDDLAARLRDSKATANAAKTDYEVACAEVQALMREAVAAVDEAGDRIATWNPTKGRTTINRAALKADGRLDKYTLTGEPGRTFRVSL